MSHITKDSVLKELRRLDESFFAEGTYVQAFTNDGLKRVEQARSSYYQYVSALRELLTELKK